LSFQSNSNKIIIRSRLKNIKRQKLKLILDTKLLLMNLNLIQARGVRHLIQVAKQISSGLLKIINRINWIYLEEKRKKYKAKNFLL
jgi:hypothetical protein